MDYNKMEEIRDAVQDIEWIKELEKEAMCKLEEDSLTPYTKDRLKHKLETIFESEYIQIRKSVGAHSERDIERIYGIAEDYDVLERMVDLRDKVLTRDVSFLKEFRNYKHFYTFIDDLEATVEKHISYLEDSITKRHWFLKND